MPSEPLLSADQRAFLESARRAVLATIAPDGQPRLVPICFVVDRRAADPLHADRRQAETGRRPLGARPRPRHRRRPAGHDPRRSLGRGLDAARLAARRRACVAARARRRRTRARRGRRGASRQVPAVRDAPTRGAPAHPRSTLERVIDWGPDVRAERAASAIEEDAPPPSGAGSGSSSSPGGSRRR